MVLDEADRMLDMGFTEDLRAILDAVPEGAARTWFSAHVPARGAPPRRLPVERGRRRGHAPRTRTRTSPTWCTSSRTPTARRR
ncbi:MAG: hypothetical protein IPF92_07595 [Myxococcales bacterium]|nr:hypothetical protein [Myxococcales bacterium]